MMAEVVEKETVATESFLGVTDRSGTVEEEDTRSILAVRHQEVQTQHPVREANRRLRRLVVDTASQCHACPPEFGQHLGRDVRGRGVRLQTATGGSIPHCGARWIRFRSQDLVIDVVMEVAAVQSVVLSADEMMQKG